MEIIRLDNDDSRNESNFKEKNYLIGSYTKYLSSRPDHDLQKNILIEIEIIYQENNPETNKDEKNENKNYLIESETDLKSSALSKKEAPKDNSVFYSLMRDNTEYSNDINDKKKYYMETCKNSAKVYFPKDKIKGTFIEEQIKSTTENYLKIELKAKKNKISLENIIDCLEYLSGEEVEFVYSKDNLISYFYAFSICKITEKRREVLEKLLLDLSEENIIYFLKVCANLEDEFLNSYSLWLIRFLLNKQENLPEIYFNGYNYNSIVKLEQGGLFKLDDKSIIYYQAHNDNRRKTNFLGANLKFLEKAYKNHSKEISKYYEINNCFNVGRILRRKSDSLIDDYPHYYQMIVENEPDLFMYAVRMSENSNFIISRSIDDFNKYGCNYIAEVSVNFWGTSFEIFDFGYEKSIYEKSPKIISDIRRKMADVKYETNIMGECPRFFEIDIYENNELLRLSNLKPEWNEEMDCYCLNFYGRVKRASAKNFQIIYPDDPDNILLQHGKVLRDEFNIDFREPFNFVTAFAISLISIGKKRVVS